LAERVAHDDGDVVLDEDAAVEREVLLGRRTERFECSYATEDELAERLRACDRLTATVETVKIPSLRVAIGRDPQRHVGADVVAVDQVLTEERAQDADDFDVRSAQPDYQIVEENLDDSRLPEGERLVQSGVRWVGEDVWPGDGGGGRESIR
jgi:hypothetical protein